MSTPGSSSSKMQAYIMPTVGGAALGYFVGPKVVPQMGDAKTLAIYGALIGAAYVLYQNRANYSSYSSGGSMSK